MGAPLPNTLVTTPRLDQAELRRPAMTCAKAATLASRDVCDPSLPPSPSDSESLNLFSVTSPIPSPAFTCSVSASESESLPLPRGLACVRLTASLAGATSRACRGSATATRDAGGGGAATLSVAVDAVGPDCGGVGAGLGHCASKADSGCSHQLSKCTLVVCVCHMAVARSAAAWLRCTTQSTRNSPAPELALMGLESKQGREVRDLFPAPTADTCHARCHAGAGTGQGRGSLHPVHHTPHATHCQR